MPDALIWIAIAYAAIAALIFLLPCDGVETNCWQDYTLDALAAILWLPILIWIDVQGLAAKLDSMIGDRP